MTTDYVRSLGYKTIWIPYYRASGYNKWWEYGIDFACMQPNHSFREGGDALLYSTAEITKKYGMCVEMEIGGTNAEYVRRYNDYLRVGAETGFIGFGAYVLSGRRGRILRSVASRPIKRSTTFTTTRICSPRTATSLRRNSF